MPLKFDQWLGSRKYGSENLSGAMGQLFGWILMLFGPTVWMQCMIIARIRYRVHRLRNGDQRIFQVYLDCLLMTWSALSKLISNLVCSGLALSCIDSHMVHHKDRALRLLWLVCSVFMKKDGWQPYLLSLLLFIF